MLRPSAPFSSHMVLQQNKENRIWGETDSLEPIKIMLSRSKKISSSDEILCEADSVPFRETEADFRNRGIPGEVPGFFFRLTLPPIPAGGPYFLHFQQGGVTQCILEDVMAGEVFLAGGQSNMEFELQNCTEAAPYFAAFNRSQDRLKGSVSGPPRDSAGGVPELQCNVRYFQVPRQAYFHDDFLTLERGAHWCTTEDPSLGTWSAVAFFFARELSQALHCCVGIIGCNWGGTSASAWQDEISLLSHADTASYITEYRDILAGMTEEEYEKKRIAYETYQQSWQPKIDAFYASHPRGTWEEALEYAGPCQWPGPMGPKHEYRPCGLYQTMLLRVAPYSLRGFLFYQGESDDHKPDAYLTLLRSMVRVWRRDFQDDSLFFLNVQLPMHHYASEPWTDSWCKIRQAQQELYLEDPYSALAVIIDQGEYDNIHPTAKEQVGHRLCLQALERIYGHLTPSQSCGPICRKAFCDREGYIRLEFAPEDIVFDEERYQKEEQLPVLHPRDSYSGLELECGDGTVRQVRAVFPKDKGILLLPVPEGCKPTAVRYLWTAYGRVSLFDQKGLPCAPFRILL